MQATHNQPRPSILSQYPVYRIGKQAAKACAFGVGAHWLYYQGLNDWYHLEPYTQFGTVFLGVYVFKTFLEYTREVRLNRYQIALNDYKENPPLREGHGHFLTDSELEAQGAFDPNKGNLVGKSIQSGRPIFLPSIHSLTISPTGKGKTTSYVIPLLLHGHREYDEKREVSRASSALVMDVKGELTAVTARHRRDNLKQEIFIITPDDPKSAAYNPLQIITRILQEHDLNEETRERLAVQAINQIANIIKPPKPPTGHQDETFWHNGVLTVIEFAILYVCLIEYKTPERFTLARVGQLLMRNYMFLVALEVAKDTPAFNGRLADLASTIESMKEKYLDTHMLGARLDWSVFTEAGIFKNCFARSDFKFSDMKHRPITVYIQGGRSDKATSAKAQTLLAGCFVLEMGLPDAIKGEREVNAVLEEATNIAFDLSKTMTLLRSYGVRCDIIGQAESEFIRSFGKNSTETIMSNVSYMLVEGGNKGESLNASISKALGDKPVSKISFNVQNPFEPITHQHSIEEEPLLRPNTIATMKARVILWEGGNILCRKATYNEFDPWWSWTDPNPNEKNRKLPQKSDFNMQYSKPDANGWQSVKVTKYKAITHPPRYISRLRRHLYRKTWVYATAFGCGLVLFGYNMEALTGHTPHVLYNFSYTGNGTYSSCDYLGFKSKVRLSFVDNCPLLHVLEPQPAYLDAWSFGQ